MAADDDDIRILYLEVIDCGDEEFELLQYWDPMAFPLGMPSHMQKVVVEKGQVPETCIQYRATAMVPPAAQLMDDKNEPSPAYPSHMHSSIHPIQFK